MKSTFTQFASILTLLLYTDSALSMDQAKKRCVRKQKPLTRLQQAALHGNITTMAELLEQGYDVNERSSDNSTPLMFAALRGHSAAIFRALLPSNPMLNARNNRGNTALHAAAKRNHPIVIKMLVRAGADPNIENMYGDTPLHVASRLGNIHALQALLEIGARIDIQNKERKLAEDIVIDAMVMREKSLAKAMPIYTWHGCPECLGTVINQIKMSASQ